MKEIIVATKNKGKTKEFAEMFQPLGFTVKTLLDFPDAPDIEETGETFAENAVLKAKGISEYFNKIVIADDSGLCVDALDGKPGVYSARYAGEAKDDEANLQKVLQELKGVPYEERTAHFHCTLALVIPGKEPVIVEGKVEGYIIDEKRGENGFGYDPIFYVPEYGKTTAEMSSDEKNKISHRGRALEKLNEWVKHAIETGELSL
ncbi:XTP/dITP diphosphatase [Pallidibacillus pasinlerensis]|uniref:dITP/XTP pyrophosphatase n=1 Tax=Pallidibacillus pasinlerensis TaxID=2703818 RepID=A0ABX0A0X1_9BACI|nr:XTP/dITP diphosphatase [Pallidibacillus pasinlerensis]NCU17058.1 XTP/dITP diphosphatase [Pallidibacillus pasinlerensis]